MKRRRFIGLGGGIAVLVLGKALNLDKVVSKEFKKFLDIATGADVRKLYRLTTDDKDYLVVFRGGKLFSGFELKNLTYGPGEGYETKLAKEFQEQLTRSERLIIADYTKKLNDGHPISYNYYLTPVLRIKKPELEMMVKKYVDKLQPVVTKK